MTNKGNEELVLELVYSGDRPVHDSNLPGLDSAYGRLVEAGLVQEVDIVITEAKLTTAGMGRLRGALLARRRIDNKRALARLNGPDDRPLIAGGKIFEARP